MVIGRSLLAPDRVAATLAIMPIEPEAGTQTTSLIGRAGKAGSAPVARNTHAATMTPKRGERNVAAHPVTCR